MGLMELKVYDAISVVCDSSQKKVPLFLLQKQNNTYLLFFFSFFLFFLFASVGAASSRSVWNYLITYMVIFNHGPQFVSGFIEGAQ